MKRIIADFLPIAFLVPLAALWTASYLRYSSLSFLYVIQAFRIPGWILILIVIAEAIICSFVWLDWRIRAIALLPIVAYGIVVPIAFFLEGGDVITSLVAAHLWIWVGLSMIGIMAVLHDNDKIRKEREKLWEDIKVEREKAEVLTIALTEAKSGAK